MKSMLIVALAAVAIVPVAARADVLSEERIVSPDRLAQDVEVRDVHARDGTVSGTIMNRSPARVRDVRLVIRHLWLWNDEFHPGTDDPSRADYFTVPDEIPPGGRVDFTYRPASPLPEGRAGRFETDVRVASVVEVTGGPSAPTAGAGMRPPADEPLE
jgi:hypothetical protein